GDRLVVRFDSAQATGEVLVSLTDAGEVTVRAPAGAVTFTSDSELLSIHNPEASASYALEIPRSAPRVEIQVAGARIFLKEGDRVTAAAPPAEGLYRLPLQP
ncbi:MAG: hypothetical protein L0214_15595, partial [candidate division NC10 bacterium]|nr:hypothetical protein [candidate division NC10 bacterium]